MLVLSNDFHRTSVRLRLADGYTITESQARRARRELCGVAGCKCGGIVGERGKQRQPDGSEVDVDYTALAGAFAIVIWFD